MLFRNPQYSAVLGDIIHIDCYKVNLKEKITASVPIEFIGESQAVKDGNVLVEVTNEVEVEALPTDLPEAIEVDISVLNAIDDMITVGDIKLDEKVEMAFAFELKDGPQPKWGLFTYDGKPKPRFYALKLLNVLGRHRLKVDGEGTYVKTIASLLPANKVSLVVVNYDESNSHLESVPLTITNLKNGRYRLIQNDLSDQPQTQEIEIGDTSFRREIIMAPNSVISLEIEPI